MCKGFGLIVSKELKLYFQEPDNYGDCCHSDILYALGWKDNEDQFIRPFVRVQFDIWIAANFEFDEDDTLPGWAEEYRDKIRIICIEKLAQCKPAYLEYRDVKDMALEKYNKKMDGYWKVHHVNCDDYDDYRNTAFAEYCVVADTAKCALVTALAAIDGYVTCKPDEQP